MEIRPFHGLRYAIPSGGDISDLVAPPYDVIGPHDRDDLLARNERNIVAVDLPHYPPSEVGPDDAYRRSAKTIARWRSEGVLVREGAPALYAYEQSFRWAGRSYTRRGMICGLRAGQMGKDVIAHEHTFAGPKADRLRLTEHTRMQLSPVFGFFDDPQSTVDSLLWNAAEGAPAVRAEIAGVADRLWPVTSGGVIGEIISALRDVPAFIADGHHRYATAARYAESLRQSGQIGRDHEANFVMFCLVPRQDPGLLVLPTHRIIRGLDNAFGIPELVGALPEFQWQRCSVDDADLSNAGQFLRRYGEGAMAFLGADPAEVWIGRLADTSPMDNLAADHPPQWRKLDVAVLHKMVIDRALAPWRTDGLNIEYTPEGRKVLAACRSGSAELGICLQGCRLDDIERIALAGATMPHKSTYFHPKLTTGMVLKPLE
jgi:uncharacterized protein (DUF1015 family)